MTQGSEQTSGQRVQWYHPGEVVVVSRVPAETRSGQVHTQVQQALPDRLRKELATGRGTTRSFAFRAPKEPTLVFTFCRLGDQRSPRTVKDIIDDVHAEIGPGQGIRRGEVELF